MNWINIKNDQIESFKSTNESDISQSSLKLVPIYPIIDLSEQLDITDSIDSFVPES